MEGSCLSLKEAAGFFSGTPSVLLTALILRFFADHSNQDGWIPRGNEAMGIGGQHTDRMGNTPNAPFSTPNATSAVLRELYFCLQCHVPRNSSYSISLPFLCHYFLCLLGCSAALPASEGLGMVIFRSFFILVTGLVLGFTEQQLKKLNILSS